MTSTSDNTGNSCALLCYICLECTDRCRNNTSSVESQLRSRRLRWLGHTFKMPKDRLPKKLCLVELRVAAPQDALGLVTMTLHEVIVMNAHY